MKLHAVGIVKLVLDSLALRIVTVGAQLLNDGHEIVQRVSRVVDDADSADGDSALKMRLDGGVELPTDG